jgi:Mg2+/Co2+ transporter CorC
VVKATTQETFQFLHFAIVIDKYGRLSVIVTIVDFLESIVGGLPDEHEQAPEGAIRSEDGT